jgi:D-alanyl-lipoteichoic acid acyltransferase DltB (MBOAT superfamily)
MLFNSFVFWGFFAGVLLLYRLLPHRAQNILLLLASYLFYGYWDYRFLSLILISTIVDFIAAQRIAGAQTPAGRRSWLTLSLSVNLGMLGFFKYWGFFVTEANQALLAIGFNSALPVLEVVLPVGISFYTFQTMSYTIDVYRGVTKPTRRPIDFALYVAFFPQLVAGPIERSSHLLPQVLRPRVIDRRALEEGAYLVLSGLFRKVVIADNMAPIVNRVFSRPLDELTAGEVLVGVYAFAFQIYGDFSGYSSIAKGVARWMGFDLMWNFRNPYFAASPSEFWRRWHISLSSWLRDYLYIPLGGNRRGRLQTFRNLFLTMGLGGLWHGAGWTFIAWGLYHGALLVGYRLAGIDDGGGRRHLLESRLGRLFAIVVFFHLICVSWLLFRAESMAQVLAFAGALPGGVWWTSFSAYGLAMITFFVTPMMLLEYWTERRDDLYALINGPLWVMALGYAYMVLMLLFFPAPAQQEFIYFQF